MLEEQERFEGWLPSAGAGGGRVEISARMELSPRSMAALWMSGFEDDDAQQRCGELCVFEIFGKDLGPDERAVGRGRCRHQGVPRPGADPGLRGATGDHRRHRSPTCTPWSGTRTRRCSAWTETVLRRCPRPPTYPLQLMLAVFDFPRVVGRRRRPPGAQARGRPDRRHPPVTATTLLVARHGQAEYEANEWAEGGSLTPLGRRQSPTLAQHARQRAGGPRLHEHAGAGRADRGDRGGAARHRGHDAPRTARVRRRLPGRAPARPRPGAGRVRPLDRRRPRRPGAGRGVGHGAGGPAPRRSSTRSPLATRARPSWSSRTAARSASVCPRCAAWTSSRPSSRTRPRSRCAPRRASGSAYGGAHDGAPVRDDLGGRAARRGGVRSADLGGGGRLADRPGPPPGGRAGRVADLFAAWRMCGRRRWPAPCRPARSSRPGWASESPRGSALREFDVGDHRGVPLEEDPFVETYARWMDGHLDERVPGGETGREIADRFDGVLREIADAHPGETVLVVSHGGAIGLGVPASPGWTPSSASCSATATPSRCCRRRRRGSARGRAPPGNA